MMNKAKEIIGKLGNAISTPFNPKYTVHSWVTNPLQPITLQNQLEILTHHRNYPCF